MTIEVTEEMKKELRAYREAEARQADPANRGRVYMYAIVEARDAAHRLARLVAEAVERAEAQREVGA